MAREVAEAEARRFGRAAGLLSIGIGSAGLLTYVYFSLASHTLGKVGLRRAGRAVVGGLRHHLDPLSPGRAAALADDRRAPGERAADRAAAAGRGDDPARPGGRLRRLCPRPPGAPPGRAPVGQRDPVLDHGRRGARLQRELLRARLSGRQPALHPLRPAAARRVHGPGLVCARGRRRHRQRPDRGRPGDRRRARAEPDGRPARLRRPRGGPEPSRAAGAGAAGIGIESARVHARRGRRLRRRRAPDHGLASRPS